MKLNSDVNNDIQCEKARIKKEMRA
jgi:hypothetical protein